MNQGNELRAGRRIKTQHAPEDEQISDGVNHAHGKRFDGQQSHVESAPSTDVELPENNEVELEQVFSNAPKRVSFGKLFFISLLVLVVVESVYSVIEAMNESWLLALLYSSVLILAIISAAVFLVRESVALKRLKYHQHHQQDGLRLLNSTQIGEAQSWLESVLKHHPQQQVAEFKASIQAHHTDKEVLQLYESSLLQSHDQKAKQIINQHATTSAMLVAMSPMALLDMLAVLWRGVHLIEAITKHYGIKLGYRSRITLYKLLVKQMVFVGATELVSDLAATSLGAELLGRLSARAGQGLSAGVFTARLGYKAMELCRPLPRLEHKPSLLKSTVNQLVNTLLKRADQADKVK
ncbi:TIGR01620 family protein [Pseudoalteromonas sp. S16_S37]|uniref:TIGR01620 family protein n=1 Tax=Pseudoalteromonas sp. S16_S37 TaxID=2720228 RepID=UPI0016815F57|nr:TIGR01620 family protein [Pseudoalteromonas sp. S16_S37]MBD1583915.1 TIGR01620 family protein [Pseudoalteromonas sp. S16_S37]